jgi:hypothetical protein
MSPRCPAGAPPEKPFDALQTLLATARDLAKVCRRPQLERLVRVPDVPRGRPRGHLQVLRKTPRGAASSRRTTTRPASPSAEPAREPLRAHPPADGGTPIQARPSQRDADIRRGVERSCRCCRSVQDAVRAQWLAASRDLARSSGGPARARRPLAKDASAGRRSRATPPTGPLIPPLDRLRTRQDRPDGRPRRSRRAAFRPCARGLPATTASRRAGSARRSWRVASRSPSPARCSLARSSRRGVAGRQEATASPRFEVRPASHPV